LILQQIFGESTEKPRHIGIFLTMIGNHATSSGSDFSPIGVT
jgi:hypothetical protein